ncbi:MAG: hypothetical protein KME14_20855 [Tildeniella torsiva UHER 1998/13D]|jgi:hypothetical protein|nr:hypothetical protein [Tildeniella torsiva UHER 1998/13D]
MELVILMICVAASQAIAILVNSLTHLSQLFAPSPWLIGGVALVLTTWIMRDE